MQFKKNSDLLKEEKVEKDLKNIKKSFKKSVYFSDLPKAIGRLIRNKLYMLLTLAFCFEVYLMGYFTFVPKYLMQHFGMSASTASIATGRPK